MDDRFLIGARVVQKVFGRFGGGLLGVKTGAIHKFIANGNFTVKWDGDAKPGAQQWRGYRDHASMTGDNHGVLHIHTPEQHAEIAGLKKQVRLKKRLDEVQKRIAALDPKNYYDDLVEFEGIIGALEKVVGPATDG